MSVEEEMLLGGIANQIDDLERRARDEQDGLCSLSLRHFPGSP